MDHIPARFTDRSEAGRLLAARLVAMKLVRPVVYALPRGGVPVGLEVARALNAPLDLVLVRKIGAPGEPELALGAVVDGDDPQTVINQDVHQSSGADAAFLAHARGRELAELGRRRALYLEGRPRVDPKGRTAIIVDDGLATGATAKAALAAIKRQGAARTILAVPVAPEKVVAEMLGDGTEIVCLRPAARFHGVSAFYADFHQLTDEEAVALLRQS